MHARAPVKVLDEFIPNRHKVPQVTPESLIRAGIKILQQHALLFYPGVVPQVERPASIPLGELQYLLGVHLGCTHHVEPKRIMTCQGLAVMQPTTAYRIAQAGFRKTIPRVKRHVEATAFRRRCNS